MDRNFLFWYYAGGLNGAVTLIRDYSRFVLYRFHTLSLVTTIFSPWKRDVTFKTWRGLHPIKSLSLLSGNIMSRIVGVFVRLPMIVVGFLVWIVVSMAGLVFLAAYVLAPALLSLGLVILPLSPVFGALMVGFGVFGSGAAIVGYALREKDDRNISLEIEVVRKKKWFPRVLNRLGVVEDEVSREALGSMDRFVEYLASIGINRAVYEHAVVIERDAEARRDREHRFWRWEHLCETQPIGKGWRYAYTPHLDRYALDLSEYDPTEYDKAVLIGRGEELRVVKIVLERPTQNSVLLVGDPGIGKKTFIHHLASLIRVNAFQDPFFRDMRVLMLDLGMVVSDAINQGEDVDNFVRVLFHEAAYAGNVLLVIEDLDRYIGGDASQHNLAPVLSSFLPLSTFRVFGTATAVRYHTLAKTDEQSLKLLEVVYLRETNEQQTFDILVQHFEQTELQRVVFTLKGFESIITAAGRYNWEWPFPERALDLAQEVLIYWRDSATERFITPETVNAFISIKIGVPTGEINEEEKQKLLRLEEFLHQRVIGQEEAVKQVAEAMRKSRVGFGNGKRPLGSFIFFGPSGVGKTETVKAFAESYFGSEDKMIRLDMSEYQTEESVERMIGSREGGVKGQLTVAAKEHPFSILLLDEIEKAYPRMLDLFLQILDEGYVTDAFGEKVSFRNMVIIATSNAGAPLIKDLVEQGAPLKTIRKQVLDEVVKLGLFRLEFLGRFDGTIFFEPLRNEQLNRVTDLKLAAFAKRLKEKKNIDILFAPEVAAKIVEKGFEPEFGMRSINRYIENTIEDAIVRKIISGEIKSGGSLTVYADDL
jgi:ATP-dependent Clp protease ATP-binding subunit ClpC